MRVLIVIAASAALGAAERGARLIADHTCVDRADSELTAEQRARVRALDMLFACQSDGEVVGQGLRELAKRHPDLYALEFADWPSASWYANGDGFGSARIGGGRLPAPKLEALIKRLDEGALGDKVDVVGMQLGHLDVPYGAQLRLAYERRMVTMEIKAYSVSLAGSFVENLVAPRIFGGGGGNPGFFGGFQNYPIELPNVEVTGLHTTAMVPAGGSWVISDPDQLQRHPQNAFAIYKQGMDEIAKKRPALAAVWTTLPLQIRDNGLRASFNTLVRDHCRKHDLPLYDYADVVSWTPGGVETRDAQGPALCREYAQTVSTPNDIGRARLARAWWWLMAGIADRRADAKVEGAGRTSGATRTD